MKTVRNQYLSETIIIGVLLHLNIFKFSNVVMPANI